MGLYLFFSFCRPNRAPHFYLPEQEGGKKKAQVLLIMLATVPLYLRGPGSRGLVYYFSLVVFLRGQVVVEDRWIFLSLTRAHKLTVLSLAL